MYIIKNIRSELYKMKHLYIKPCLIAIPILYALVIVGYESCLNCDVQKTYKFFLGGMCLIFPIMLSLYLSIMDVVEYKAGNFQNILSNKNSKIQYFISRIILLISLTLFILLISFMVLAVGSVLIYNMYLPIGLFLQGIILFALSSISMITIYLVLTYMFGINMAISLGGIGLLIVGIVGTTALGDNIWCFFPSSYSLRVCFNLIIKTSYTIGQIYIGLIVTIASLILSCLWFLKWEGRKNIST